MNSAIALFQVKEIIYNDFENKIFLLHPTNVWPKSKGIRIKKSKH